MGNDKVLRKTRLPDQVNGMHSTEVEIARSTCDDSNVVIVPDIELPKIEESALEADAKCRLHRLILSYTRRLIKPLGQVAGLLSNSLDDSDCNSQIWFLINL
jgi:hypothetical protein